MKKYMIFALVALVLMISPASAAVTAWQAITENGSYALRQSGHVDARVLAADTAESAPVPTYTASNGEPRYANFVVFSADCDFYTNMFGTATVPVDTTNGTASEMNPAVRYLEGNVTSISLITESDTCNVTMMFYR